MENKVDYLRAASKLRHRSWAASSYELTYEYLRIRFRLCVDCWLLRILTLKFEESCKFCECFVILLISIRYRSDRRNASPHDESPRRQLTNSWIVGREGGAREACFTARLRAAAVGLHRSTLRPAFTGSYRSYMNSELTTVDFVTWSSKIILYPHSSKLTTRCCVYPKSNSINRLNSVVRPSIIQGYQGNTDRKVEMVGVDRWQ